MYLGGNMDKNIKRGEVWFVDLGSPKGSEQGYSRPCIVISNDYNNKHSTQAQIVSVTSANKKNLPVHLKVGKGKFGLYDDSIVLGETIQQVHKSQFQYYMGTVDDDTMELVEHKVKIQLALI